MWLTSFQVEMHQDPEALEAFQAVRSTFHHESHESHESHEPAVCALQSFLLQLWGARWDVGQGPSWKRTVPWSHTTWGNARPSPCTCGERINRSSAALPGQSPRRIFPLQRHHSKSTFKVKVNSTWEKMMHTISCNGRIHIRKSLNTQFWPLSAKRKL